MRRIQRAILCPFTITGWGVMSFTFIFLSLGVSKIFEASKLVLTGNFTHDHIFTKICEVRVEKLSHDDSLCNGVIDLSLNKYQLSENNHIDLMV